jgi:hypothetical protein
MSRMIDEEEQFDHKAYAEELAIRRARIVDARRRGSVSLKRLVAVAQGDSGQSEVCGRFLLSIYNGMAFNFNMNEFRRLQDDLWDDCMAVLAMDHRPHAEVHQLVEDGPKLWELLKVKWATDK